MPGDMGWGELPERGARPLLPAPAAGLTPLEEDVRRGRSVGGLGPGAAPCDVVRWCTYVPVDLTERSCVEGSGNTNGPSREVKR